MKVLRVLTRPNLGGPTRQAIALWHAHRELGVRTLLAVGAVGEGEASLDLTSAGLPPLDLDDPQIETRAGHVVVPGLGRAVGGLREWAALRRLRALIRAWRPDVVHTHTSKAGVLGRLAARAERVPCLHTYHGHVFRDHLGAWQEALAVRVERWLARRTDRVLAISASCRADLAELGITPDARVIAPAVESRRVVDREAARCALDLDPARTAVVFAGRMVGVKRPELVVAGARARPGWSFLAFGDGPLRDQLVADAPANLRVLPGRSDLPELFAAFDLLLMPSHREGFPLAGVEALAAGVPTVGFDVPGVRDLVRESGHGAVVAPGLGVAGLVAACDEVVARGPVDRERAGRLLARCAPLAVAVELRRLYETCGGST